MAIWISLNTDERQVAKRNNSSRGAVDQGRSDAESKAALVNGCAMVAYLAVA
ncbi:MAG: hypothetical protein F6K11_13675 [Leptolyngbya sp. SIO3F4]|nr:hypothetical protein [Leptolyngbya sp. SIO3F4]